MSQVVTEADAVLEQLEARDQKMLLRINGHQLSVTNLDKVLWPGVGRNKPLTKRTATPRAT